MRGISLAFVALLMFVLSPAPAGTALHEPLPEHPNRFGWTAPAAPAAHADDILVELGVDYGEENACVVYMAAAGRITHSGLHFIAMGDEWWAAGSGGSTLTYAAQAHVGDIDTRLITDPSDGYWAGRIALWGTGFHGTETWTFAAFDTESWTAGDETFSRFELEISCADPFEVTSLAGSTSVMGFDQRSMEGIGASSDIPYGPEAAVNHQDGLSGSFDTDETVFAIRGFQINGASAAQVTVDHPGGTTNRVLTTFDPDMDLRGPGGDYRFHLDRASAGQVDVFRGILGGLDPVEDLDEIVA